MLLFYLAPSPPCRAVILFMHTINLYTDRKVIDIFDGENQTPEFLTMNPQHTVPLIEDNGFVLSESRAILGYLAEKYSNDSTYYPNDPMARGVVNQRLMFDVGTLYQSFIEAYLRPMITGEKKMNMDALGKLHASLGWLNTFMGDAPYMAGNKLTIADFSIITTISTMDEIGIDLSPYPQVLGWFVRCKNEMRHYKEGNGIGAKMLAGKVKLALGL